MNIKLIAVSPRVTKPIGKESSLYAMCGQRYNKKSDTVISSNKKTRLCVKSIMNAHVSAGRKMKIPSWGNEGAFVRW